MDGNINNDEHQAEVAMLSHEIYELNKKLQEKELEQQQSMTLDKYNPFDNSTDYPDYSGDYSDIVPQIKIPGCKIPVEPSPSEKKRLRKFYTIGGANVLFHFLFSNIAALALIKLVMVILQMKNPGETYTALYNYAYGSSIIISISMLVYMTANVIFAYTGLKMSHLGGKSLISTRDFGVLRAIQYCFCAIFMQYAASILATLCDNILGQYGYTAEVDESGFATTGRALIVLTLYQCIIAPITEELFYRGMILKTFARANQRFAIFASAIFFGLAHGNIPQFLLAFILGIFLAHIDIIHNSILPSVIVHMFVNITSMILNRIYETGSTAEINISNMIYLVIAAIGLMLLYFFIKKRMIPRTTPQQSRRGFAVAKTSFTVIIAFLALAGNTLLTVLFS